MLAWLRLFFGRLVGRDAMDDASSLEHDAEVRAALADAGAMAAPTAGEWRLDELLGVGEWFAETLTVTESVRVDALAEQVIAHLAAHRPEPSSFPALAARIIDLVEQPEVDLAELARLVEQDPAIAARVLRAANAAIYIRQQTIVSVRQAIAQLGLQTVAQIAVAMAGRSLFDMEARAEFELFSARWSGLFHHSVTTAFGASWCCPERGASSERAFLGGMFHDVGKSVTLRSLASLVIAGKVPKSELPDPVIDELVERLHVPVGVALHGIWGLPDFLRDICLHHHDAASPGGASVELHAVRLVSALDVVRVTPGRLSTLEREVRGSAEAIGIDGPGLRALLGRVEDWATHTTELFDVPDTARRARQPKPLRAAG